MTLTADRIYTPEELLGEPALEGHELVDGHVRERPASKRSSRVAGEILRLLGNEATKTGEAVVYPNDLGYHCFPDSPSRLND
jgi:hypothetical protein